MPKKDQALILSPTPPLYPCTKISVCSPHYSETLSHEPPEGQVWTITQRLIPNFKRLFLMMASESKNIDLLHSVR